MKVLILDDDVTLLKTLCKQLNEMGIETHGISEPTRLSQTVQAVKPNILFMDIELGEFNGITLSAELKTYAPHLPLIFISNQLSPEVKTKAIESGGLAYVDKPLTAHLLAAYARRYATDWAKEVEIAQPNEGASNTMRVGRLEIRFDERLICFPDGSMRDMSPMQASVLKHLAAQAGNVVPKEDLSYEIWRSRDMVKSREQSLHNTVHRLRVMLSADPSVTISNVRGCGYILEQE